MKISKFWTFLLVACLASGLLPFVSAQESESWKGTIEQPDQPEVKVEVSFARSFSGISGSLKMPDLTPVAFPMSNLEIEGRNVYFELEMGPSLAIYDGERISSRSIKGNLTVRNPPAGGTSKASFSLELNEKTVDLSNSIEQSVKLDTTTGSIYGTLLTPDLWKPPIALLIAGAGSSDRDGNLGTGPVNPELKPNVLKLLAIGLANEGIATVRFDKRGVGESISEDFDEEDLRAETYVSDVSGWLSKLKADDRFSKLLVIGYQEGALLAKLAAIQVSVSGVVSLAGAGVPLDQLMLEQVENHPDVFRQLALVQDQLESTLAALKKGEEIGDLPPVLQSLFIEQARDYLKSWFKYDPQQIASRISVPFLVVQGTTDLQVARSNGQILATASPNAQLVEIEQMNQVLKESGESIPQQIAVLANPDAPLHTELVPVVAEFVNNLGN